MGMQKPQFLQYEKKYLATAMVLFEYCAAFKILMREKTVQQIENFLAGVTFLLSAMLLLFADGAPNLFERSDIRRKFIGLLQQIYLSH